MLKSSISLFHSLSLRHSLVTLAVVMSGPLFANRCSLAGEPRVQFDAPALVAFERLAAADVESVRLAADRELVELSLDITAWAVTYHEANLEQLMVEIVDLSGSARVVDFSPIDMQYSDYASGIAVEELKEKNASLGVDAASTLDWVARGNAHANLGSRKSTKHTFEKKAPQSQVIASGMTRQGRGVSFRIKQSAETPLEGSHHLTVRLSVPEGWSTSLLRVECLAVGRPSSGVKALQQRQTLGHQRFLVATFDRHDASAGMLAESFAAGLTSLRRVASAQQKQIQRRSQGDAIQRVGILLAVSEPKIPKQWLQQLVETGDSTQFATYADRLPGDVRRAGLNYLAVRRDLLKFQR